MKPLGKRSYGSIPHLLGSKLGPGDYHLHEGQHKICTEKTRDKYDTVIVQEKYDGSNVAIAKQGNRVLALTRKGYLAETSPFEQHHYFAKWVERNKRFFDMMLKPGERICGEWMLQAHGLKYKIRTYPFVAFDFFVNDQRLNYINFCKKICEYGVGPKTVWIGSPIETDDAFRLLGETYHDIESEERPEGLIYRVERHGKVDFLAKFVRSDFEPGKYLPEISMKPPVFNLDPKLI